MFGSTMRIAVCILAVVLCVPAYAVHHLMQIETVIGSVNGDTAAQAIQLRMRSGSQNSLSGSKLKCYDAAGANPVVLFDFNSPVSNGSTGDRVLLTTAAFDALTTPECVSDFTLANRIPDSYFAAGRVTFEEDDGSVLWALAWGGNAYTGSNTGNDDNDADGDFGAAFGGPLADSVKYPQAAAPFHLTLAATALSTTNVANYEVASNGAVTNNDGDAFDVDGGPKSIVVTAPDSGDHLDTGTSFDIRWNFTGNISKKVRIELFDGPDKIGTIVKRTKYNKKFAWDVPGGLPDGTNYRVRVLDKANGVSDKSGAFTIGTH